MEKRKEKLASYAKQSSDQFAGPKMLPTPNTNPNLPVTATNAGNASLANDAGGSGSNIQQKQQPGANPGQPALNQPYNRGNVKRLSFQCNPAAKQKINALNLQFDQNAIQQIRQNQQFRRASIQKNTLLSQISVDSEKNQKGRCKALKQSPNLNQIKEEEHTIIRVKTSSQMISHSRISNQSREPENQDKGTGCEQQVSIYQNYYQSKEQLPPVDQAQIEMERFDQQHDWTKYFPHNNFTVIQEELNKIFMENYERRQREIREELKNKRKKMNLNRSRKSIVPRKSLKKNKQSQDSAEINQSQAINAHQSSSQIKQSDLISAPVSKENLVNK